MTKKTDSLSSNKVQKKIKLGKRKGNYKVPAHAFKPGQVANPAGRKPGSRNKFGEAFLADMLTDWQEHGASAIRNVREQDPSTYLRVAAGILPKELTINTDDAVLDKFMDGLSDDELSDVIAGLRALGASKQDGAQANQAEDGAEPDSLH